MRKLRYSKDANVLVIELSEKPIEYAEDYGQLIVHFSAKGEPVLLEVLDAKAFVLDSLSSVLQEQEITIP